MHLLHPIGTFCRLAGSYWQKGAPKWRGIVVGVIYKEELCCDFCGKKVPESEVALLGKLSLRKQGVRGVGRQLNLVLHERCGARLMQHSTQR